VGLLVGAVEAVGASRVVAHHVRHGLRDDAADAALCEAVCARLGVRLLVTAFAPGEVEAMGGEGTQDRARRARYGALAQAARAQGLGAVMTGHHRDDAVETALMRALRGAGLEGVAGMREASPLRGVVDIGDDDGRAEAVGEARAVWLLRPLLGVSRAALEAMLEAREMPWAEDPTNATDAYLRNRLRRGVLPPLAACAPDGTLAGMGRTLSTLRGDADALGWLTARLLDDAGHWTPEPAWYGLRARLGPHAVAAQALRQAARRVVPGHTPTAHAVTQALARLDDPTRGLWRDGVVEMGREGRWVIVRALGAPPPPAPPPWPCADSPCGSSGPLHWARARSPEADDALRAALACRPHARLPADIPAPWALAPLGDAARDPRLKDALRALGVPPRLRPLAWGLRDATHTLRWVPGLSPLRAAPHTANAHASVWVWLQDLPWFLRGDG
jgi:tRNA(Ile)-lysidine synthetase-like protein